MDELGITNIGIVNALIKLTQKRDIRWNSKIFTKSCSEVYVPEGSIVVRYRTNALHREIDLFVRDNQPTFLTIETIQVISYTNNLEELTIPPLIALYRAIEGTDGNIEVRLRRDFLSELNKLADA